MVKKLLALILAFCMVLPLAACGKKAETPAAETTAAETTAAETAAASSAETNAESTTDGVTIKAFMYEWPSTDDAAIMEEINKELGFTIEWIGCPGNEGWSAQERLLAVDPTIDIFYLSPSMFAKFQANGMLADLSQYQNQTEQYPNLADYSLAKMDLIKTKDGSIYGLPLQTNGAGTCFYDLTVRSDWMNETGMEMPKTIEELDALLAAMKEKHPDKYPLLDQIGGTFGYMSADIIAKAFSEGGNDWYLDADGKLAHPIMNPGYKDYVAQMADWYQKGYLHPQFVEMNGSGPVTQLMTAGDVGVTFSFYTDPINPNISMRDSGSDGKFEYVFGALTGAAGGGLRKNPEITTYVGINVNSKNLDACMKALDFFSSEKGTILVNQGIEGRNYEMVDGILSKSEDPDYDYQGQYNPYGNVAVSRTIQSGNEYMDTLYATYDTIFYNPDHMACMYSAPDANFVYDWTGKQYKTLEAQVNTFITELITNTITGKRSLDDWDAGVQEALSMGLQTMVDERNEMYNAVK